jgi:uncharacterized OB-fold protein
LSEKVRFFPGKEIPLESLTNGDVLITKFKADLKYSWASGVAVGRFLSELKNGKLIARKCNKCKRILIPPRMFCEDCFRETDEWVFVKDTGVVNTYSIAHVGTDAHRLSKPLFVAVITIDGASELMGFLHLLGEVQEKEIKIGMKVQAVWKPPEQRVGSILDVQYFKPVKV